MRCTSKAQRKAKSWAFGEKLITIPKGSSFTFKGLGRANIDPKPLGICLCECFLLNMVSPKRRKEELGERIYYIEDDDRMWWESIEFCRTDETEFPHSTFFFTLSSCFRFSAFFPIRRRRFVALTLGPGCAYHRPSFSPQNFAISFSQKGKTHQMNVTSETSKNWIYKKKLN